ncbi:MAG: HAMP domain-containing histidine kinase [Lewinellaceae bacterium]|nr:HAMP domain-containing histidine kinase [Phaeodactylibacter sp.]MCB0615691.1 HAMP domain-containing histidine kinase [Phaeodactylibacter sp.]MCB9351858.1 HAMP domain-containing histidine kinase [Lewinellaceae bacterium]
MNLITKTTILYLLVAMLVFGIGGVVTFYLVQKEVQKETDFALRDNLDQIAEELAEGIPLNFIKRGKVDITDLGILPRDTFNNFSDTLAPHPYLEGQMEPYRKLTAVREVNGRYYQVSITDVFIETDDIYDVVVDIMLRLFFILSVAMLFFSFLITGWLFRPFQKTLEHIRSFNLKEEEILDLPETSTKEFRQLNAFVAQMAYKARRDYLSVKEFSENASHEMQTPLAIARGKLELLLETPALTDEQLELVQSAQQNIDKLSKLGKVLLLLTRIENKEFANNQEPVDFSGITRSCLENFDELASLKGLPLSNRIEPDVHLIVDPTLADILVANLVKNAIRHNVPGGWVEVRLDAEKLRVRNSGPAPRVPSEQLFERFQKSRHGDGSLGLGLAIVKKIAEVNNFQVSHQFSEGVHEVTVRFHP